MAATVTLSMEIELGWGFHDLSGPVPYLSSDREPETATLEGLVRACERTAIPISFDVVGYLLHESFEPVDGSPHDSDWLPVGEGSTVSDAPLFYAPDLVAAIRDSPVDHEICSHTYTHAILGDRPESIDWELERAVNVHEAFDLPQPVSLVPPRHSIPEDLRLGNGFEVLRLPAEHEPANPVRRYVSLLNRSHPLEPPSRDEYCVTYSTSNTSLTAPFLQIGQASPHPSFRAVPRAVRERLHSRYLRRSLNRAIETDSYVHYWTHLYNMANEVQRPIVFDFLDRLRRERERGNVVVETMEGLATRV